jgi:hypothetical protein
MGEKTVFIFILPGTGMIQQLNIFIIAIINLCIYFSSKLWTQIIFYIFRKIET